MRHIKIKLLACLLGIVLVATFTTIAVLTSDHIYYVVALWLLVAVLFGLSLILLRASNSILRKIEQASARVNDLSAQQKRQHQELVEYFEPILGRTDVSRLKLGGSSQHQHLNQDAKLAAINSRIQRAERRVLGRLEDELHAVDLRYRKLEEIISQLAAK